MTFILKNLLHNSYEKNFFKKHKNIQDQKYLFFAFSDCAISNNLIDQLDKIALISIINCSTLNI